MKQLEIQAMKEGYNGNVVIYNKEAVLRKDFETTEEALACLDTWLKNANHRKNFVIAYVYDVEYKMFHGKKLRIINNIVLTIDDEIENI